MTSRVFNDDSDYDNYDSDYYEDDYWDEKPIYKDGQLAAMTQEQLFVEMDRAYNAQASCVDNGGSDDQSYRLERRCSLVHDEIKRRVLDDAYWARPEPLEYAA